MIKFEDLNIGEPVYSEMYGKGVITSMEATGGQLNRAFKVQLRFPSLEIEYVSESGVFYQLDPVPDLEQCVSGSEVFRATSAEAAEKRAQMAELALKNAETRERKLNDFRDRVARIVAAPYYADDTLVEMIERTFDPEHVRGVEYMSKKGCEAVKERDEARGQCDATKAELKKVKDQLGATMRAYDELRASDANLRALLKDKERTIQNEIDLGTKAMTERDAALKARDVAMAERNAVIAYLSKVQHFAPQETMHLVSATHEAGADRPWVTSLKLSSVAGGTTAEIKVHRDNVFDAVMGLSSDTKLREDLKTALGDLKDAKQTVERVQNAREQELRQLAASEEARQTLAKAFNEVDEKCMHLGWDFSNTLNAANRANDNLREEVKKFNGNALALAIFDREIPRIAGLPHGTSRQECLEKLEQKLATLALDRVNLLKLQEGVSNALLSIGSTTIIVPLGSSSVSFDQV